MTATVIALPDRDKAFLGHAAGLAQSWNAPIMMITDHPDMASPYASTVLAHPPTHGEARAQLVPQDAQIVLAPDTETGRDVARRVAVARGWRVACSVQRLDDDTPVSVNAGWETLHPQTRVWCLRDDFSGPVAQPGPVGQVQRVTLPETKVHEERRQTISAADLPLSQAPFVVAAGDGVADLALFHRFATALGAATGASRVLCDRGDMPREKQIGSSGQITHARTYVALGISGAVQHLDGIRTCETVVAVNTDPSAPIHSRASLSLTVDTTALMLATLTQLKRQA